MRLALAVSLAVIVCFAATTAAADVWYFNDGTSTSGYWWADDTIAPFWEWMSPDAIAPGDTTCTYVDIPNDQAYYACSGPIDDIWMSCSAWAEIWLANNSADGVNPVSAELGIAACGNAPSFTSLAGPVTVNVTNQMGPPCGGQKYTFDFGQVGMIAPNGTSLVVKITYSGVPYDTHIYWDGDCCPSALYVECVSPVEEGSWGTIKGLYR